MLVAGWTQRKKENNEESSGEDDSDEDDSKSDQSKSLEFDKSIGSDEEKEDNPMINNVSLKKNGKRDKSDRMISKVKDLLR